MAAVTGVRDGREAVAGTTKGMLLIYTLLSLVYFKSAMFDTGLLTVKESNQLQKEKFEKLKNDRNELVDIIPDQIRFFQNIVEQMMKEYMEEFPDDYLLLEKIKNSKETLDKLKVYFDTTNSKLGAQIEDLEVLLKQNDQKINCLERNQRA